MKKIYFLLILFFVLIPNTFSQTVFPLEVGTKWYYQGYHYVYVNDITQKKDYYYGIIKEVTGIVNNSTREITAKYIYKDSLVSKKEYWSFKDGKFYDNYDIIFDIRLERDTCYQITFDFFCKGIINYQIFNISDYAQFYRHTTASAFYHSYTLYTVTLPGVGIVEKMDRYNSLYTGTKVDSSYLIGMYTGGLFLGDTTFYITRYTVTIYEYNLSQNYPNPFNLSTAIEYSIAKTSFVTLKVYDVLGREVEALVNEEKPAGNYNVEFNGNDFSSGIYFYKIRAGDYSEVKKMVLLK